MDPRRTPNNTVLELQFSKKKLKNQKLFERSGDRMVTGGSVEDVLEKIYNTARNLFIVVLFSQTYLRKQEISNRRIHSCMKIVINV